MRAIKNQNGYTIVETMIVLAVTGAMLTATILLVSGQIARYQFRSSVYNIQQQLQGILNDVQTGYFDLVGDADAACNDPPDTSVAGNSDCVYIGKKVTTNTNGEITVESLWQAIDAESPIGKPASGLQSTSMQTTQLPSGFVYTATEFYVLFSNYSVTTGTNFQGGAQSTAVYIKDLSNKINLPPVSPAYNKSQKLCIKDGNRKASMVIGLGGATTVDVNYQPSATECPLNDT